MFGWSVNKFYVDSLQGAQAPPTFARFDDVFTTGLIALIIGQMATSGCLGLLRLLTVVIYPTNYDHTAPGCRAFRDVEWPACFRFCARWAEQPAECSLEFCISKEYFDLLA